MTTDEGWMGAGRRAIRSGCIPTGGWDWIEGVLSERDVGTGWMSVLGWSMGEGVATIGGSELSIVGLNAFVSS